MVSATMPRDFKSRAHGRKPAQSRLALTMEATSGDWVKSAAVLPGVVLPATQYGGFGGDGGPIEEVGGDDEVVGVESRFEEEEAAMRRAKSRKARSSSALRGRPRMTYSR
jgi:hypothetical protein